MKPVILIEKTDELTALASELARTRFVAIDTESNSFYAYFERICLIQISTTHNDYIVDPVAIGELSALRHVMEDPAIEKIFHAAANDVTGLKRDFGFHIRNIFDTAIAYKLLGHKRLGLARILEREFGVVLNKKWQRHDWGRRPLRPEQLDYARLDAHYLIYLRHRLAEKLRTRHLLETALEEFEKESAQEAQEKRFQPEAFIHISGARSLDPTGRRILKALYLYREHEARRRNRAPFRILTNDTLLRIAFERPKSLKEFSAVKGLPRSYQNARSAHVLLDLIRKIDGFGEERSAKS